MASYPYAFTTALGAGGSALSALATAAPANSDIVVTNTTGTYTSKAVADAMVLDDVLKPTSIKYVGKDGVLDTVKVVALTNVNAATTVNGGTGMDSIFLTGGIATVTYDALDEVTAGAAAQYTIDASTSTTAVNWDLSLASNAAGAIAFASAAGAVVADAIEGVIGTQYADTLKGAKAGDVTLNGGNGADKLYSQAGATTTKFIYDANDALVDGSVVGTNDTLDATANTAGIQLYLDGNAVFKGIETVLGGSGSDDLRGDASTKSLDGGKGVDYIWGGLNGTAQVLNGGAGNDQYWFGAGEGAVKSVFYAAGQGAGDVVNLYNISAYDLVGVDAAGTGKMLVAGANGTISNGTEKLIMTNAAGKADATRHFVSSEGWAFDVVFGDAAGTAVTGTAGVIDNLIGGGAGATFDGKGGNDNIYTATVGASNIVYHAGDTIFSTAATANTLTALSSTNGVQMYMDSIVNTSFGAAKQAASWSLIGSAQDDEIRGQADVVAQTLNGGAGNDALWGGAGSTNLDTLIGGAGADTYYYGIDEGNDTIQAGAAAATGNSLDTLNFYNVSDVSKLSGTLTPGGNMTINIAGTGVTTMVLQGWGAASGINKLTNVVVNGAAYTLSADSSNNAVFTAK